MVKGITGRCYKHSNGYSAILYGKSSMSVYFGERRVMHTGSRNVNTESEVMKILEKMPEFLEAISEVADERK